MEWRVKRLTDRDKKLVQTHQQTKTTSYTSRIYRSYFKRAMDIVLSATALIVGAPTIIIVAVLVRSKLGSPVLFRQTRAGYQGQLFEVLKFRTMTDERDDNGELLPDELRLTPFGQFLRKYSLDELPQLINVLRGDLSLVGPRPLLVQYLELYTPEQMRRHEVLPGVTGLAQVNGRRDISWEKKFAYDIEYVDNVSLQMDLTIMFKTALEMVRPSSASYSGGGYFTGSPQPTETEARPEEAEDMEATQPLTAAHFMVELDADRNDMILPADEDETAASLPMMAAPQPQQTDRAEVQPAYVKRSRTQTGSLVLAAE